MTDTVLSKPGFPFSPKARPVAGYRGRSQEMACSMLVPDFSSYPSVHSLPVPILLSAPRV